MSARARMTGIYFTGQMAIPTRCGKIDLGLLARGLLAGMQAARLSADEWEVTSSNRFARGPYVVRLSGETAACECEAAAHHAPCSHISVARYLAATLSDREGTT